MAKTDWSLPFLKQPSYQMAEDGLTVSYNGESIRFGSPLLALKTLEQGPASREIADIEIKAELSSFLTLDARVSIKKDCKITEVAWLCGSAGLPGTLINASTEKSGICAFIRKGSVSFFLSLDFPYSEINGTTISYPPYDDVKEGDEYRVHTLTIGAAELTGEIAGEYDRAEIEAFSQYVSLRFPTKFNRPVAITTSIANRLTYVKNGRIMYSMHDNPTLASMPAMLEYEVDMCSELGIEYYQMFEAYFDRYDEPAIHEALDRIIARGKEKGVRIGVLIHMIDLVLKEWFVGSRDVVLQGAPLPDKWRTVDSEGNRRGFCYGCDEFVDFLSETLVKDFTEKGVDMLTFDFFFDEPCYSDGHNHPPNSKYCNNNNKSNYSTIRGLTRVMERLSAISPNFLVWSNCGCWADYMPKLVWYNPNVYITDPHLRDYCPTLSLLKHFDDSRREQMVSSHNKLFVPYQYLCNYEYYAFRNSRVEDMQFFEYGILQGLSVTPNISYGEVRQFFERVPSAKLEYCKSFIREWRGFIKENFDVWKNVFQLGDSPGAGANEAYVHAKDNHGFICLVNQNHYTNTTEITVDGSLGIAEGFAGGGGGGLGIAENFTGGGQGTAEGFAGGGLGVAEKFTGGGQGTAEGFAGGGLGVAEKLTGGGGGQCTAEKGGFVFFEEYPHKCLISEQPIPCARFGDRISLAVPPFSVRIIRFEPADDYFKDRMYVYGLPAGFPADENGGAKAGRLELTGECGKTYDIALYDKNGLSFKSISAAPVSAVPHFTFPCRLAVLDIGDYAARFRLAFPGDYFKREILNWKLDNGGKYYRLNFANSDFCGGYIHNFYREDKAVEIALSDGRQACANPEALADANAVVNADAVSDAVVDADANAADDLNDAPARRSGIYETEFYVPYIGTLKFSQYMTQDEVLELVFKDCAHVKSVKAELNGAECEVRKYIYPGNSHMSWYIELLGKVESDTLVNLKLYIEWAGLL